ncbi:MAG: hypothetical protein A4E32_01623 [Methanomassiliicoccales archaeon PtaU1.Bin124]|nr:MAG: hypothetical protein A4E32_01623 [Methanomassiliicoccales archaeon PtaU1.Bin124]
MPRSWFNWNYCRSCMKKGVVIKTKMTIFGLAAYAFDALALALIFAKLFNYNIGLGGNDIYVIFALVAIGFGCQFIEVGKAQKIALKNIAEHYPKHRS